MKKTLFVLLIIAGTAIAIRAQSVKVTTVQNYTLRTLLTSVDTVIFKDDRYVRVSLYKVANPSGSAHQPGTDEVSHKYFIGIANGDQDPEINLYQVGEFYAPKILKFELSEGRCHILIEYGGYKHPKRADVVATLKDIVLKNI